MKFAIADPPYYGKAKRWYGKGGVGYGYGKGQADNHPDAELWDKPEAHLQLLRDLESQYEGFAIATSVYGLNVYLQQVDLGWSSGYRLAIWHKPISAPSGSRIRNAYEPVIIKVPESRRGYKSHARMDDIATINIRRNGFIGSKPKEWTWWVLDLMGANAADRIDDLFHGSGAVESAIQEWRELRMATPEAQPVKLLGKSH